MAPFSFPPPPPPPPSTSSSDPPSYQHLNGRAGDGGQGRGRGSRGGYGSRGSFGGQRGAPTSSMFNRTVSGGLVPSPRNATDMRPAQERANFGSHKRHQVPKPQTAPAIPQFGAPLPRPPVPQSASPPAPQQANSKSKKRKRTSNFLGLTPGGEDHESSEEDVDEEAVFTGKGLAVQFEHRGRTIRLDSPEALKAWIAERRKNWPVAAKVEAAKAERAKKKAEIDKRKQETERRKHEARAAVDLVKQERLSIKAKKKFDALKTSMEARAEPATKDVGGGGSDSDAESSIVSDDTSSSSDEASDDEAPEEVTRKEAPPTRIPPPRSNPPASTAANVCTKWTTTGKCFGQLKGRCPMAHPRHLRASTMSAGPRPSLRERLVEQQLDQDAYKLLEAVKILAENGILGDLGED